MPYRAPRGADRKGITPTGARSRNRNRNRKYRKRRREKEADKRAQKGKAFQHWRQSALALQRKHCPSLGPTPIRPLQPRG